MARSIRTTVYVPKELCANLGQAAEIIYVSGAWVILGAMRQRLSKQGASLMVLHAYLGVAYPEPRDCLMTS